MSLSESSFHLGALRTYQNWMQTQPSIRSGQFVIIGPPDYHIQIAETYEASLDLVRNWSPKHVFIVQYPNRILSSRRMINLEILLTSDQNTSPGLEDSVPLLSPDSSYSIHSDLTSVESLEVGMSHSTMEIYHRVDQSAGALIRAHL